MLITFKLAHRYVQDNVMNQKMAKFSIIKVRDGARCELG